MRAGRSKVVQGNMPMVLYIPQHSHGRLHVINGFLRCSLFAFLPDTALGCVRGHM